MYSFAKTLVGAIYYILFRFKVVGAENIPDNGGVILCSNHKSIHDTIVLGLVGHKRKPHFVAKNELFKNRFFGGILRSLGAIPINRENPEMKSLKQAVSVLKEGKALAIFMQGTRRQSIDYADAKAGVALFAIKGKVPVIPVYITSKFHFFSKIYINIGKPISFEEFWDKKVRTLELNQVAQKVMDQIAFLGGEARQLNG